MRVAWLGDVQIIVSMCFFAVVAVRRPFHKKQTHHNFVVKLVDVFREGCRHHFFNNCECQRVPKMSQPKMIIYIYIYKHDPQGFQIADGHHALNMCKHVQKTTPK